MNASVCQIDYETGAISAFETIFTNIVLKGCFFHYTQVRMNMMWSRRSNNSIFTGCLS